MKRSYTLVLLIIISLIPLIDLLRPGIPLTHDGPDHVARIANFYLSLTEGNIVPRWAANLNWGFGHPILMFLYPLPSYMASLFRLIGFSFVDSTKLVFAVAFIASVVSMFVWLRAWLGAILPAFTGALLYGFAPYRFIDLYVRGAIGEHVAFIFPPLICWGLLKLAKEKNASSTAGLIISVATLGLLLSHNAMSLMFFPIILSYIVYLYIFKTGRRTLFFVHSFWFIFNGALLSAFFLMPAFFEGKYTLRDIVTKDGFGDRFVPIVSFFYSSWNYGGGNQFSKEIGAAQLIGIFTALIFFFKHKEKHIRILLLSLLIMLITSIFLMTLPSQVIWQKITIMQKFQFPWRFLSVIVFLAAVLGGLSVTLVVRKKLFALLIICVVFVATFPMWRAQEYSIKDESYYSDMYDSTTDTGESSPIWSTRFMEKRALAPIEIIEGDAIIRQIVKSTTSHQYRIDAMAPTRVVENTLYFPNWEVSVDGTSVLTEFQDPNYRGLMTFWVDPGKHDVTVSFGDTKLRHVANFISSIGLVMFLTTVFFLWKKRT